MEVGTILAADVKTSAGNYVNFFVVSSLQKKTFYAKRIGLQIVAKATIGKKQTNMIKPNPADVFDKEFKISADMRGAFVGDDKDRKTINKMYVVETTADTAHKIVFDASRL